MITNYKKIVYLCSLCLWSSIILAKPRTIQDVISIAERNILSGSSVHSFQKRSVSRAELTIVSSSKAYHIVNIGNKGFVVVSSDDEMPELLGYCEGDNFYKDNIPPALLMWLNNYDKEFEAWKNAKNQSIKINQGEQSVDVRELETVTQLITTQWGQQTPYNHYCPVDCNDRVCPTGCTTTAIAQIMKYWQWPEQGIGKNSYEYVCAEDSSFRRMLSADFESTHYQWDNMVEYYGLGSPLSINLTTSDQQDAVATLMYHIAVAQQVHFVYNGTGMNNAEIRTRTFPALFSHFGYADDIQVYAKDYCLLDSLEVILHDELMAHRPMLVIGVDMSQGGHAFICDGYDNHLFHFNWGWYGLGDGWFRLSALNPSVSNTSYGFNSYVQFFAGIHPINQQEQIKNEGHILVADSMVVVPDANYDNLYLAKIYGLTIAGVHDYTKELSIALYMADTDNIFYLLHPKNGIDFPMHSIDLFYGYSTLNPVHKYFPIEENLPGDNYRIAAVYKNSIGEWTPVSLLGGSKYINFRKHWGVVIGGPVSVYTITGQFVTRLCEWKGFDEIKHLNFPRGIYIIKQENNVIKFSNF